MGRTLKRVPLDFDWPLNEVWAGYVSPESLTDEELDDWQGVDPPTGDGYQLWETTSEGSPMSPVFASLDALCAWAAEHATTFGDYTATAADWKRMLTTGLVYHREGGVMFL